MGLESQGWNQLLTRNINQHWGLGKTRQDKAKALVSVANDARASHQSPYDPLRDLAELFNVIYYFSFIYFLIAERRLGLDTDSWGIIGSAADTSNSTEGPA
jgi:hypothetical protein